MPDKRFSIVVTSYNQRAFVRAAVDSALQQNRSLAEVIVVDDASTDGSGELLREYGSDIRLVIFPSNRGAIAARNEGAALANGSYLIFLDGDDLFIPGALDVYEKVIAARHPAIILAERIWFEGQTPPASQPISPASIEIVEYPQLMEKDRPYGTCASALIVDRQVYSEIGGWSPGIFQMDTVDYTTKLGYSGRTILICSPATVLYRVHAANSVNSVPPFLRMAQRILAKERAGEYPGGSEHRFDRYAWLGGVIVFWIKRALRAGLYKDGFRLAWNGAPMLLAAILRRLTLRVRGLRPAEVLE
jgi:glycosyltransferase involved in cell wall biosynthesis